MEPIRISKFFTDCGVLSRRAAESAIAGGLVTVNGQTAQIGQKIDPETDRVCFRGKPVVLPRGKAFHYVLLNKPRGFVTTMRDEKGREDVSALVKSVGARVYPVGRLDMDSDGLLLLTDDGQLANRLTHPRHEIAKIYRVLVAGKPTDEQIAVLRSPLKLDGRPILPVKVQVKRTQAEGTVLIMTLREGRNRQIRRMCELAGLRVLALTRTAIGGITLGNLPIGAWRELTDAEIQSLGGQGVRS